MINAAIIALAIAGAQSIGTTAAPRTTTITGRVLTTDGHPVPRARVRLSGGDSPPAVTETDPTGSYEFHDVLPARYTLAAAKAGYLLRAYGQRRVADPPAAIDLRDGMPRAHIDVVLPRGGAIAGRIVDEYGDPVEGAHVRALTMRRVGGRPRLVDVTTSRARLTDDDGRYRIYGLADGEYVVEASVGQIRFPAPLPIDLPGYAPSYYPGTASASMARAVIVAADRTTAAVDFGLVTAPTVHVTGTVVTSTGEPFGGMLTLRPTERSGAPMRRVGARISGGGFDFPHVAPGEYLVEAYRGRRSSSVLGEYASRVVTVTGRARVEIDMQTAPGATLSGRISAEAVALTPTQVTLAAVLADTDSGYDEAVADVQDDGTFEMAGLNGTRRLQLRHAPAGLTLKMVSVNGEDVTDRPLAFTPSASALVSVEVVLAPGAEVWGVATAPDGEPLAGAAVVLFPTSRDRWYVGSRYVRLTAASPDGRFTVAGLPPGTYAIAAAHTTDPEALLDAAALQRLLPAAAQVTVTEGLRLQVNAPLVRR